MKTRLLIATIALTAMSISTTLANPIRFGVTAGLQCSQPKDFDARMGYHIGAKTDIALSNGVSGAYVEVGALLTAKGWKDNMEVVGAAEKAQWKCRLHYLEIPVHIGYKYALGEQISLMASAGPYLGIGITGKSTIEGGEAADGANDAYTGNLFKNDAYHRLDFGVGAKVGIEINSKIQVTAGYEMGLIKPTGDLWKMISSKDRTVSISLGYMF